MPGRRPDEPVDENLHGFYGNLLTGVNRKYLSGLVFLNQGNSSFVFDFYTDPTSFAVRKLDRTGSADRVGTTDSGLII